MQPARFDARRARFSKWRAYLELPSLKVIPNTAKRLLHTALFIALSLFTYHCSLGTVIAGSGLVSSVGGVAFTQGTSQFWHTSSRPTISGITTAGATVSGTLGSATVSATADSSGNWSWTPAADLSGDNAVSITSGSQTVTFTLTIGSVPADVATASGGTLAPAGTVTPTLIFLTGGAALVLIGTFGLSLTFNKSKK